MSQKQQILKYLEEGNKLTKLQSLILFGCMNTGARILELRADHDIQTEMVKRNGKRVAQYSL